MAPDSDPGSDRTALKRLVARLIRDNFQRHADRLAPLVELGIVDRESLQRLPEDLDFAGAVRRFVDRVSEIAETQPSVLKQLSVRPIAVLSADSEAEPPAGEPDRVERAVAFSDLEGFTTFTSERGDVEASALLKSHHDMVLAVVRSRGGSVVKTLGDGHMLSFREPSAAVMACVDLVAASPDPLRLRAGAHLGMVVSTDSDLFGHVVNVAARVADLAEGGEAMVTVGLRDAAGPLPRIGYGEPLNAALAGLEEKVAVCQVKAA